MMVEILAFGIAKDIFGGATTEVTYADQMTVATLKEQLEAQYPQLKELASYMVAVNEAYAEDDVILSAKDEIAIIPPVSGG